MDNSTHFKARWCSVPQQDTTESDIAVLRARYRAELAEEARILAVKKEYYGYSGMSVKESMKAAWFSVRVLAREFFTDPMHTQLRVWLYMSWALIGGAIFGLNDREPAMF